MPICPPCQEGGKANKRLVFCTDEGDLQGAEQARDDAMEHHSHCVGTKQCVCQHAVGFRHNIQR